jgi:hypothetical protein
MLLSQPRPRFGPGCRLGREPVEAILSTDLLEFLRVIEGDEYHKVMNIYVWSGPMSPRTSDMRSPVLVECCPLRPLNTMNIVEGSHVSPATEGIPWTKGNSIKMYAIQEVNAARPETATPI